MNTFVVQVTKDNLNRAKEYYFERYDTIGGDMIITTLVEYAASYDTDNESFEAVSKVFYELRNQGFTPRATRIITTDAPDITNAIIQREEKYRSQYQN